MLKQGISADQKGTSKDLNVLFSDIQNFTNLSESLSPEQVINLLNTVFGPVTECITDNEGMLDKYIGDEVMALFNAPHDVDDYQNKSIKAAIEIQKSLESTNKILESESLPPVKLSLGLANGPVVVGNMGSAKLRLNYTAVGNTVNLAARITGLSKIYGQAVLITREIYDQLNEVNQSGFQFVDQIIVKGKSTVTHLYGLQSVSEQIPEQAKIKYMEAYTFYEAGDFVQAAILFRALKNDFQHTAASCLAERCQQFQLHPPDDWDGVYKFDRK
jgi:adenylate cyclase